MRCAVIAFALVFSACAEDSVRGLWNSEFGGARPAPAQPAATSRNYIGITLWRLRPARTTDPPGTRILVHERQHTPVRLDAGAPLNEGDRVRISLESARGGYLYVFDREVYTGGALGEPVLIFPAQGLRGGTNQVQAGRLVDLPAWDDDPNYLTLQRSRPDHVGEQIVVLVAPKPIAEIGAARTVPAAKLVEWQKQWGAGVKMLNSPKTTGAAATANEKAAAQGKVVLGRNDPLPQTLYRVDAPPSNPVVVSLDLKVAALGR